MQNYDLPKKYADKAIRESIDQLHKQARAGIFDEGDPNHPKWNNGINYATGLPANIFGYDTKEFLQKQYK